MVLMSVFRPTLKKRKKKTSRKFHVEMVNNNKKNSPQQVTLFFSPKTPEIQVTQGPDIPSSAAEL